MSSEGKPISQILADEITEMIMKYHESGLENAQAIGVLDMIKFNLNADMRETTIKNERPY